VLAFLCVLFFRDAVFLKGVLFHFDHSLQNFPYRLFFAQGLRSGHLRLWTNAIFCGFPLFAEGQGNPCYPLFPLLFGLFEPWVAYNYYTVAHYFLAGFFTYVLARILDIPRAGAVLAGVCYMLSGPILAHCHHTNIVVGIAYLPLLLALIESAFRRNSLLPVILFALATAALILGAQPQYTLYNALVCAIFLAWRLKLAEETHQGGKRSIRPIALAGAFGVSALLAAVITAVQLLPFLELVGHSSRSVPGMSFARATSISPAHLITFMLPHYFGLTGLGSYWGTGWTGIYAENAVYVGFLPLLLALIGAVANRRRKVVFFWVLGVFSVLFCLGMNGPLYRPFEHLPVFRSTRFPARFGFVTALCVALLAGWGLESLLRTSSLQEHPVKRNRAALLSLAAMLMVCVLAITTAGAFNKELMSLTHVALTRRLPLGGTFIQVLENHLHETLPSDIWRLVLAASAGTLMVVFSLAGIMPGRLTIALCIVLVFLELAFIGRAEKPVIIPALYTNPPDAALIIKRHGPGRTFHYRLYDPYTDTLAGYPSPSTQGWARRPDSFLSCLATLPLNSNMLWEVPTVNGFCPLQTLSLKALLGRPTDPQTVIPYDISPPIDLLGARYILTARKDMPPRFRLLTQVGRLNVFENTAALPRAFIVHRGRLCTDLERAVQELRSRRFDYRAEILLHDAGVEPLAAGDGPAEPGESAHILKDTGDCVVIQAKLHRPGYLVLADQFYPGWEVCVDGRKERILKVNYMLRGVRLAAGTHEVRFNFRPRSFRVGLAISIGGLMALFVLTLGAAAVDVRRNSTRRGENPPATDRTCRPAMLRLLACTVAVCVALTPLCNIESWKTIPSVLDPNSYVSKRYLVLSYYAGTRKERAASLSYLLRAYLWQPQNPVLRRTLAKRCESVIPQIVEEGNIQAAREIIRQVRDAAPEALPEDLYRQLKARIAAQERNGQFD